jgi:ribonuclease HI
MTLQAVIAVLEKLAKLPRMELRIYSDSEYLVKGMNEYIDEWKQRGWKRKSGGTPENIDLWKRLNGLALRHNVDWVWLDKNERDSFHQIATKLADEAAKAELLKT